MERAREVMVEKLCSYPILSYFDVTRPAWLYTDASYCIVGAVLGQIDETVVNTFAIFWQGIT